MSWDVVISAFAGTLCAIAVTATIDVIASKIQRRRLRARHASPLRVSEETGNRMRRARAQQDAAWKKVSELAAQISPPVSFVDRPEMERTRMPVVDLADPDAGAAARADEHTRPTRPQPPLDRRPPPTPMPGPPGVGTPFTTARKK